MKVKLRPHATNSLPRSWLAGLCAALALALAATPGVVEAHQHRQRTDGPSPAYWGGERSHAVYRDCSGRLRLRLNPAEAHIRQLDPRLRQPSDGRLLEEVGSPRPPVEPVEILPYSSAPVITVIPRRFFFYGAKRGYGSTHKRN
jgi:hypothetical protein